MALAEASLEEPSLVSNLALDHQNPKTLPLSLQNLPTFIATHEEMETLQALRQQVQGQTGDVQQKVSSQFENIRNWAMNCVQNASGTLREYANRYPPLAAFLLTFGLLSAVPVTTFALFATISSAIVLTIALIGFSIVEGTMLAAAGGLLLIVLAGIGVFTTCSFGFLAFIYAGYRLGSNVINQLYQAGSSITSSISQSIPSVSSNIPRVPGASGMTPLSR